VVVGMGPVVVVIGAVALVVDVVETTAGFTVVGITLFSIVLK